MKTILFQLILFIPLLGFSQLDIKSPNEERTQIGEIKMMGTTFIQCDFFTTDSSYLFTFKNSEYSQIESFESFIIHSNVSFNQLYDVIVLGILENEKTEKEITLKNGDILTLKFKNKGVYFYLWNGTYSSFSNMKYNKKHIDKLFGKA